jgi:hypothetical protein
VLKNGSRNNPDERLGTHRVMSFHGIRLIRGVRGGPAAGVPELDSIGGSDDIARRRKVCATERGTANR